MTQSTSEDATSTQDPPVSLYQAVMSDDRARYAFYNTTEGTLLGCPGDEEVQEVKSLLDERHIAYFFNPDDTRPRPMFLTPDHVFVGAEQITSHIERISPITP